MVLPFPSFPAWNSTPCPPQPSLHNRGALQPRVPTKPVGCQQHPHPHAAQPGWRGRTSASSHCFPPLASCRQLGCAWDLPGLGGRGGFLDSCSQAKSTEEAPAWPLPFPAQRGQEHELLLQRRAERSGTTCTASPSPDKQPPNQHRAVYVPAATRQNLVSMGFFGGGYLGVCPRAWCKAIGCKPLWCRGRTWITGGVYGCWGPCRMLNLAWPHPKGDLFTLLPTLGLLSGGIQPGRGMRMWSQTLGATWPPA